MRRALATGKPAEALRACAGLLLPRSDAPEIREEREAHDEPCASPGSALDGNRGAMRARDVRNDRETQARAGRVGRAGFSGDPIELAENLPLLASWDADAAVGDLHQRVAAVGAHPDEEVRAVACKLDGVANEVREQLVQPFRVAEDRNLTSRKGGLDVKPLERELIFE